MTPSAIWWEQIGNSLRFLTQTAAALRDERSVILHIPDGLPWPQTFRNALDARRAALGSDRRLIRQRWTPGAVPGQFILERLCSAYTVTQYWPGESHGKYLGTRGDPGLTGCCIWVSDIHDKADLLRWTAFIRDYEGQAGAPEQRATFILEYSGEAPERLPLDRIEYRVQRYDCRVFCLELAAALSSTELWGYQAELALEVGGANPELCAALLAQGTTLLLDPHAAAAGAAAVCRRRDGAPIPFPGAQQIDSAARKAAMVLLFPILEQYRLDFITAHQAALRCRLPITNSGGEQITNPFDLELGPLCYVISTLGDRLPAAECETVRHCHRVRNLLAHNKRVPCPDVKRVLALQSQFGGV